MSKKNDIINKIKVFNINNNGLGIAKSEKGKVYFIKNGVPGDLLDIKITRKTEYGDKYKLFVINKNTYEENYNLENYGLNIAESNDNIIVDTLDWKGNAKKNGLEMEDIISEIKIENFDRPNKDIVYIFSFIVLISSSIFCFIVRSVGKDSILIL